MKYIVAYPDSLITFESFTQARLFAHEKMRGKVIVYEIKEAAIMFPSADKEKRKA